MGRVLPVLQGKQIYSYHVHWFCAPICICSFLGVQWYDCTKMVWQRLVAYPSIIGAIPGSCFISGLTTIYVWSICFNQPHFIRAEISLKVHLCISTAESQRKIIKYGIPCYINKYEDYQFITNGMLRCISCSPSHGLKSALGATFYIVTATTSPEVKVLVYLYIQQRTIEGSIIFFVQQL